MATALVIASTALQAIGQIRAARAQSDAAKFNARVNEINAANAEAQGKFEETRVRREISQRLGAIRANTGASGLTLEGSPLDLLEDSAREGELDALITRNNFQNQAFNFRTQASLDRANASNAKTAGFISAAGTLLKGGASVSGGGSNQQGTSAFSLG